MRKKINNVFFAFKLNFQQQTLFRFLNKIQCLQKKCCKTSQVQVVVMSSLPLEWLSFSQKQKMWVRVYVRVWVCACASLNTKQVSMCKFSATRWPNTPCRSSSILMVCLTQHLYSSVTTFVWQNDKWEEKKEEGHMCLEMDP